MGKYFGTDGFRGEANVDLTVMHAFEIGRYLGWYYGKNLPCAQDSRPRAPMHIFCMSQQRQAFPTLHAPMILTAAL